MPIYSQNAGGTYARMDVNRRFTNADRQALTGTPPGFHTNGYLSWIEFPGLIYQGRIFTPEVVSGTTYDKTGALTAGTQVYGADVFEAAEAGSLTTRALPAGADVFEAVETGSLTTRALSSGLDSFQPVEAGSLTTAAQLRGADVFNANELGTTPVGTLLSGVSVYVPAGPVTHEKTGALTVGTVAAGIDSEERIEAGSLTTKATLAGVDSEIWQETGTLPVGTLLSGVSEKVGSVVYQKTGALTTAVQLRGADASTFVETGPLVVGTRLAGIDATTLNRAGSLLVDTLLAGVAEYVPLPTEGFPGMFDSDTERGRIRTLVTSDGIEVVGGGQSGARVSSGGFTSVQSGKIEAE